MKPWIVGFFASAGMLFGSCSYDDEILLEPGIWEIKEAKFRPSNSIRKEDVSNQFSEIGFEFTVDRRIIKSYYDKALILEGTYCQETDFIPVGEIMIFDKHIEAILSSGSGEMEVIRWYEIGKCKGDLTLNSYKNEGVYSLKLRKIK